jgi:hypothetical protein
MNIQDIPDDDTGQAIKRWAAEGSDLTKPMEIDFFLAVDNELLGSKVSSEPDLAGFNVSVEKDDETGRWTCYCTKTMIPDYPTIIEFEALLTAVAKRLGVGYEGFGSFGNVGP